MPEITLRNHRFRVGDTVVEPRRNRIVKADGHVVVVEPRVVDVLIVLADRAGEVVSRDTLANEVWRQAVVSDSSVTQAVSELRRLLGDDSRLPRTIETVRKRGYRWVAPIEMLPQTGLTPPALPAEVAPWRWTRPPGLAVRRVLAIMGAGALILGAVLLIFRFLGPGNGSPTPSMPPTQTPTQAAATPSRWITTLPGREIYPDLSRTGDMLVFAGQRQDGQGTDLWLHDSATGTSGLLLEAPDWKLSPTFTADAATVTFLRTVEPGRWHLEVIPVVGGVPERLLSFEAEGLPEVSPSPDGRLLVYGYAPPRQGPRLRVFDRRTGEDHPLLPPGDGLDGDTQPVWSPDGAHLAFVRLQERLEDLFVLRVSDRRVRRLSRDRSGIYDLAWLDEKTLLFSSYRHGTCALWQIPINGSAEGSYSPTPFPPTLGAQDVGFVTTSSHGHIVYEQRRQRIATYLYPATSAGFGPAQRELFASSRKQLAVRPAPTGTVWAWLSDRGGDWGLWVADHAEATPRRLAGIAGLSAGSSPRWSPDGSRLTFVAEVDGQYDIWLVRVSDGRAQRLTSDPEVDMAPDWSADGRRILFASQRAHDMAGLEPAGSRWRLWQQGLTESAPTLLVASPSFRGQETADGTLYYSLPEASGLMRLSPGRSAEHLELPLAFRDWANWQVVGGLVYFVTVDGDVRTYDVSTGTARTILRPRAAVPNHGLAATPESLVVATLEEDEGDLVWLAVP